MDKSIVCGFLGHPVDLRILSHRIRHGTERYVAAVQCNASKVKVAGGDVGAVPCRAASSSVATHRATGLEPGAS